MFNKILGSFIWLLSKWQLEILLVMIKKHDWWPLYFNAFTSVHLIKIRLSVLLLSNQEILLSRNIFLWMIWISWSINMGLANSHHVFFLCVCFSTDHCPWVWGVITHTCSSHTHESEHPHSLNIFARNELSASKEYYELGFASTFKKVLSDVNAAQNICILLIIT